MRAALAVLLALAAVAAHADPPFARTEPREPCASHDPLRQPFFGDTHVHTAFSFDAWGQGTLAGPRDAYRFARGERGEREGGGGRSHPNTPNRFAVGWRPNGVS